MKISYNWLQSYFDAPLPPVEELSDAITFHAFEIDAVEEIQGDTVLDVKVLPDRTHDCLSYRGVAKEVAAILNVPLKEDPLAVAFALTPATDKVAVSIQEKSLCARYIAGYIRGVKVGPSPSWLAERLASMGQRSINNVVDATNFVMFNLGQPLHAFDAGNLTSKDGVYAIDVRRAKDDEKMVALDLKEYTLPSTTLVISDANSGVPVGIAGIKGGTPAAIADSTEDIIIESANFNGVSVRKTSRALNLRTDASQRFENVIAPELAAYGMQAAVRLIQKLAGGEIVGFTDIYPNPEPRGVIEISAHDVNRLYGTNITTEETEAIINRFGWEYKKSGESFTVSVPFERLDVTLVEDVAADIGRVYGLEHIVSVPPPQAVESAAINKRFYYIDRIRQFLVEKGFSEIYTSVFTLEGKRQVLNKVDSDKPYLRSDIAPALRDALEMNFRNKELLGLFDVRLFEIGTVWKEKGEKVTLCLGTIGTKETPKGSDFLHELFAEFDVKIANVFPESSIVEIDLETLLAAAPDPLSYQTLPTLGGVRYKPFSRFPVALRDVAVWTPEGTEVSAVEKIIKENAGGYVVRLDLFDTFSKEGRTSYAFHLVFQATDKTLSDEEVHPKMDAVYSALKAAGYEIR